MCTFRSLLWVKLITYLRRKLQKKREILDSMLTGARIQRDKCPLVGSRNLPSRYKCTSYSSCLPFSPRPLNFPRNDTYTRHTGTWSGARSWCPHTLAAFNTGAMLLCLRSSCRETPTTLFQGLALSEIHTYGLRRDEYRVLKKFYIL